MKTSITFIALLLATFTTANAQILTDSSYVPVRISSMNGQVLNNQNRLTWKTACFLQYARFDIQRSYDGVNFGSIENFTADQLRCQQPFDFNDSIGNSFSGKVFYRIRVGDIDGRYFNSKVVALFMKSEGWEVHSITPTIVSSTASLSISSSFTDKATFFITNPGGTVVLTKQITVNKGLNSIPVDASALQAGRYWVIIHTDKMDKKTISFIKQ